jgi:hypothetical protein
MWPVRSDHDISQSLRQRVSELADVVASSNTVLGTHGVDYFARRDHVQLQVQEGRLEVVLVLSPTLANREVFRVLLAML